MKEILLVDDDEAICAFLSILLGKIHKVKVAYDGIGAMYHLSEGYIPDLIITDLKMPELSGFDLIRNIKNSQIYRHIPIIVLTGSVCTEARETCYLLGIEDYINKPFNPYKLKDRITYFLNTETI